MHRPPSRARGYVYFTAAEAAFIEAAVERLIPSDPVGPGAVEAGVPVFIDRQLAGPYGRGDHFFLGGPWPQGVPSRATRPGTPRRSSTAPPFPAIDRYVGTAHKGAGFTSLAAGDQDEVLRRWKAARPIWAAASMPRLSSPCCCRTPRKAISPIRSTAGNRDMGAWKMIGFPGAHYDYREWVTRHGEKVPFEPVGFMGRPGWREG